MSAMLSRETSERERRDNLLKAYRFKGPDFIPAVFYISSAAWQQYDAEALNKVIAAHPRIFPGLKPGQVDPDKIAFEPYERAGIPYTDPWGSVWETSENGITGCITRHPLADWEDFTSYRAPDPEHFTHIGPVDWEQQQKAVRQGKSAGRMTRGGLHHGHLFLRLTYIRGFENMIFDMADDDPRLPELIGMIEKVSAYTVRRYVDMGVDMIGFPEDLGSQTGPLVSPSMFRRYITPVYTRLMEPVRDAGILVHMHTDGHIMDLMDQLLEAGVQVINLQDLVNGIDRIRDELKGRVAVDLDIDRQSVTRFGSPGDIDGHIREAVEKLSDPSGGLSMIYGLYPGIPLENIRAVAEAMDKYSFL